MCVPFIRLEALLAEDDADQKGHDVPRAGLSLRQLYHLKKEADAWFYVYKNRVRGVERLSFHIEDYAHPAPGSHGRNTGEERGASRPVPANDYPRGKVPPRNK
jgi:hypothetical protein